MRTIIATLATGSYRIGAEVLMHSIRKHSNTAGVDLLVLGEDRRAEYDWIPTDQEKFPDVAQKLRAFALDADRVILLDADMLCLRDCSFLWSDVFYQLPLYAVHDTAAQIYYGDRLQAEGLNTNLIFNCGTVVYHPRTFPGLHDLLLADIRAGFIRSYDGSDQGYLNAYCQRHGIEVGYLPAGYNYALDEFMPRVPDCERYLVHFTGGGANPWLAPRPEGWRGAYFDAWQAERREMNLELFTGAKGSES